MTRTESVALIAASIGLAFLGGCGSDNTLVPLSNSIATQLGTGGTAGIVPGGLPSGSLAAPTVSSATTAGIQGGTAPLTVITAAPVTNILVAETGQNGYLNFTPTSTGTGPQTYNLQLFIPTMAAVDQQILQVETVGIAGVSKPTTVLLNVGPKVNVR